MYVCMYILTYVATWLDSMLKLCNYNHLKESKDYKLSSKYSGRMTLLIIIHNSTRVANNSCTQTLTLSV